MRKNRLRRSRRRTATPVVMALLIAGCASADPSETAEYRYGWVDGCYVGLEDAGRSGYGKYEHKDHAKYRQAGEYRRGWDAAYQSCYEEEMRHPTMDAGGGV